MERSYSKKRPWLAALLGAAATGVGHLYLRRWLRGAGWVAVAAFVSDLSVPGTAIGAAATPGQIPWLDLLPVLMVSLASAFDAYQIAVVNNYLTSMSSQGEPISHSCPSCGRPVDEELEFCQWCATRTPKTQTTAIADVRLLIGSFSHGFELSRGR